MDRRKFLASGSALATLGALGFYSDSYLSRFPGIQGVYKGFFEKMVHWEISQIQSGWKNYLDYHPDKINVGSKAPFYGVTLRNRRGSNSTEVPSWKFCDPRNTNSSCRITEVGELTPVTLALVDQHLKSPIDIRVFKIPPGQQTLEIDLVGLGNKPRDLMTLILPLSSFGISVVNAQTMHKLHLEFGRPFLFSGNEKFSIQNNSNESSSNFIFAYLYKSEHKGLS